MWKVFECKDSQSTFKSSTCSGNAESAACNQRVLATSSPMNAHLPTRNNNNNKNNNKYHIFVIWILVDTSYMDTH